MSEQDNTKDILIQSNNGSLLIISDGDGNCVGLSGRHDFNYQDFEEWGKPTVETIDKLISMMRLNVRELNMVISELSNAKERIEAEGIYCSPHDYFS